MASHGCAIVETPRGCAKELTVVLCDRLRVPNIALGGPPLRTRITSVLRWSLRKPGFRDRRTTQPPQSTRPHRAPAPPRARAALPPPPALATAPFANTAQLLHPSLAPVKPFFSPSPRALIPDTSRPLPRAPSLAPRAAFPQPPRRRARLRGSACASGYGDTLMGTANGTPAGTTDGTLRDLLGGGVRREAKPVEGDAKDITPRGVHLRVPRMGASLFGA
jgi:hypothetical protein